MLARIGAALDSEIVSLGAGPTHLRVNGPTTLSGSIEVKTSKNAGVALLCASLLNRGRTTLRKVARIEEVNRLLEVLASLGVQTRWFNETDLEIIPPAELDLEHIDEAAARRTRSVIMFLGPLLHRSDDFELPYAGGCNLGTRTVEPHMSALRPFGLEVKATDGSYHARVNRAVEPTRPIVLTERGDTVTENALMAAALHPGTTVIRNASSNYMVQDLCFFLQRLGVDIEGVGTTTLTVTGGPRSTSTSTTRPARTRSRRCRCWRPRSSPTRRSRSSGCRSSSSRSSWRPWRRWASTTPARTSTSPTTATPAWSTSPRKPSELHAPLDKIHPMPFPGLNIDNLPFFAVIAAVADRPDPAPRLGLREPRDLPRRAQQARRPVKLLDPHRVLIEGPTHFSGAEIMCPPALRPAVVILLAMLAAKGTSVLRSTYVIHRGYEGLAERLNELGANIETFRDI